MMFQMLQPLIIKVGGSLYSHAEMIIHTIRASRRDVLIIPGGGHFADNIRDTGVQGTEAHWMAIAAMEQYGWYLSSFGIPVTITPEFIGRPVIFLPYQYLRDTDPLEHSWVITSDTISAWIALQTKSPLLILKSIDKIRTEGEPVDMIRSLIRTDDLDPAFIPFIQINRISGQIINGSNQKRLMSALSDGSVPGTRFGDTI